MGNIVNARPINEYYANDGLCYIEDEDEGMAFTGGFELSSVLSLCPDADISSLDGG